MNNIKKYIYLLLAACVGMTACVKDDMNLGNPDGLVTFKAFFSGVDSDAETKTVLNDLTPYWTSSDSITVYDGVINSFKAVLAAPSDTAVFSGKLEGKGRTRYLAVSPYSADVTFSALSPVFYGLKVPAQQVGVENSYDPAALVTIAHSTTYDLVFKNVCSLVKFKIVSDGVTSVTLRSNGDEVLVGTFQAAYADAPTVTPGEGKNEVVLSGSFKKGSTYYIVTLPATLKSGFTATLKTSSGETVESLNYGARVTLKRSGILNIGDLSLTPAPAPEEGGDDTGNDNNDDATNDNGGTSTVGKIYLHPSNDWKQADARFAAYFFEGDNNTWVDMTDTDGDGNYECAVPDGYSGVIFARMNPAVTQNRWNTQEEEGLDNRPVWNQTPDLYVPTGNSICYVVNPGKWNPTDDDFGYWSSYPPMINEDTTGGDNSGNNGGDNGGNNGGTVSSCKLFVRVNKSINWYDKYIYAWEGSGDSANKLCGDWPGTKTLWSHEDGDYYVNYHEFDASLNGKTINYIINGGENSGQTKDLSVTLNGAETTVTIESTDL